MRIDGRTAVVTGAASGLGLATAESLIEAGACVGLIDHDEALLEAACERLGERAAALCADLAVEDDVQRAVAAVTERFDGPHILVNAAGVAPARRIVDRNGPMSLDEFRRVIDVNLVGTFDVMRWCAAAMVGNDPDDEGERGVVVNVSSGAAWQGQKGQAAYAASKAGVLGMTLPVARDLAGHGIRVLAVAPGLFDTAMASGLPEPVRESLEALALQPSRLGRPEEFAMLVRHIVENPYLNATTLSIDAGIRMV